MMYLQGIHCRMQTHLSDKYIHVGLFHYSSPLSHSPPPLPPKRSQCKSTATESIGNHSDILIGPLNIVFVEGPCRGLPVKWKMIIFTVQILVD